MRKSQVSMEFLMTTGMMMILFLSVFVISEFRKKEILEYEDNVEFKYPCNYMTSMINNVYSMGNGAKIKGQVKQNTVILGQNRLVLIWKQEDNENKTIFCNYIPYNVINGYNTAFNIPRLTNFTVSNVNGTIEVRESVLEDGLVLWLRMDRNDTDDTIFDSSENQYIAEISANCSNKEGYSNNHNGCNFEPNQYIKIIHDEYLMPEKEITIAFWMKEISEGYIVDKSDTDLLLNNLGYKVYTENNEINIQVFTNEENGDKLISTPIVQNTWTHIITTYDGTNITLYVDGENKVSSVKKESLLGANTNLLLGKSQSDANYWEGNLDDFRLYNRSMTKQEAKRLYESYSNYVTLMGEDFIR